MAAATDLVALRCKVLGTTWLSKLSSARPAESSSSGTCREVDFLDNKNSSPNKTWMQTFLEKLIGLSSTSSRKGELAENMLENLI